MDLLPGICDLSATRQNLAITATFTAEPVKESLKFWMRELGQSWEIEFSPYNQVFAQLLDSASLLSQNRGGANVILIRLEDLLRFAPQEERAPGPRRADRLQRDVRELVSAVKLAAGRSDTPCLVFLCPDSRAAMDDPDWVALAAQMESLLEQELDRARGVSLTTTSEVATLYPVPDYDDAYRDELGHVPYTPLYFAALGTAIIRRVHWLPRAPYKVIVLDCDQTLWKGVCAEDGIDGIEIDPPRKRLQEFIVAQQKAGMLLCLCSRNREEDIAQVFARREMPLTREHIVSWRINWSPKSENIRSLAEELGLGLDSFIFLDDDLIACAEVRANRPEVLALALPRDVDRIPRFLEHVWAFDRTRVTQEDTQRTALYRQDLERRRLEEQSSSFEDFLTGLALQVRLAPIDPEQIPRVAQLTQRTNQFNATGKRRSEREIQTLDRYGLECLVVDVSDRFGHYGLVGVLIFEAASEALRVDTFLLSCRALGRGVEKHMLGELGRIARERSLGWVEVPYRVSERNQPALEFLESVCGGFKQAADSSLVVFRLPAEFAAGIPDGPASGGPPMSPKTAGGRQLPAPPEERSKRPRADSERVSRIASHLSTPQQIIQAIASAGFRARPGTEASYVEARGNLERRLVGMWEELLQVARVGVEDNFFELGGDSIQATLLISRVRDAFGPELSLPEFFDSPTVVGLARAIDRWEIDRADEREIAALLEDVARVSDEDIRAQLTREGSEMPQEGKERLSVAVRRRQ